jgi:hypothetical protein
VDAAESVEEFGGHADRSVVPGRCGRLVW